MRLSVDNTDSGFHHLAYLGTPILDGIQVKDCFTADEELGEVHVYARDENNKLIIEDGALKRKILKGVVKIIFPDGFK